MDQQRPAQQAPYSFKRTHDQMESDHGSRSSSWNFNPNSRASSRTDSAPPQPANPDDRESFFLQTFLGRNMPPRASRVGHGGGQQGRDSQNVIDLTSEEGDEAGSNNENRRPRSPTRRGGAVGRGAPRDIIDVDALPERHPPSSPEVQFRFSRPISPRRLPRAPPQAPHPVEPQDQLGHFGYNAEQLLRSFDGRLTNRGPAAAVAAAEAGLVRTQAGVRPHNTGSAGGGDWSFGFRQFLPGARAGDNNTGWGIPTRAREVVDRALNQGVFGLQARNDAALPPARPLGPNLLGAGGFVPPDGLDYDVVALNDEGVAAVASNRPRPAPTYDAPEAARNGFTRSPEEDDLIVCPNCGDELGVGEKEVKRSVWFVKACGHVYCGECTAHRRKASHKKGTDGLFSRKGGAFKSCVVCAKEGVTTPVTHREKMKQIFL